MKRVSISIPHQLGIPLTVFSDNWLYPFTLSNQVDLDLKKSNFIEVVETHHQENNQSTLEGKLLFTHLVTVPYDDLVNKYIRIGNAAIIAVNEKKKKADMCHVGIAFFENTDNGYYRNAALLVLQDSDDLNNISLHNLSFNYSQLEEDYEEDDNPPLICLFKNFNTGLVPMNKILDFIYPQLIAATFEEKFKCALDDLFGKNFGLVSDFTDPYSGHGIRFERKLIDYQKQVYQKVHASVQYCIFGKLVTYHFDISEAPTNPTDLAYTSYKIETGKLYLTCPELSDAVLAQYVDTAFNVVKGSYMFKDRYYSRLKK